jgi:ferredoxin
MQGKKLNSFTELSMITKVWIDESEEKCVYCGACEAVCEQVFDASTTNHCIIKDADYSNYEVDIRDAADFCPAGVIRFAEDGKEFKRKEEPHKEEPRKEEPREQTNLLSFEDAYAIIRKRIPLDRIYIDKISAFMCEIVGAPSVITSVRATWTKPKHELTKASTYDLILDHGQLRYKMFYKDLSGKYIKSRQLKSYLHDIKVQDFIDLVETSLRIAN